MSVTEDLAKEFLSQKSVAVVGVSNNRDTGCNANYKKFKDNGYRVYAVNPHIALFDGTTCYPDLKSIPEKPDAVFILASPKVTDQIVQECVDLGIGYVWMHCLMGTKPGIAGKITSVSQPAVELCRSNGIKVIPGSCPAQFLKPDFPHAMFKGIWKLFGFLK